jgi:hypothetical protein
MNATTTTRPSAELINDGPVLQAMSNSGAALGWHDPKAWQRTEAFRRAFDDALDVAREMVADDAADPPDFNIWNNAVERLGPYASVLPAPLVGLLQLGGVSVEWHECGLNIEVRFRKDTAPYVVIEDVRGVCPAFHGRKDSASALDFALRVLAQRLDEPA